MISLWNLSAAGFKVLLKLIYCTNISESQQWRSEVNEYCVLDSCKALRLNKLFAKKLTEIIKFFTENFISRVVNNLKSSLLFDVQSNNTFLPQLLMINRTRNFDFPEELKQAIKTENGTNVNSLLLL